MSIVKCQHGHFYDNVKHKECPVCKNDNYTNNDNPTISSNLFGFNGNANADAQTEAIDKNVDDDQMTIPLYVIDNEYNPVVGWIISLTGAFKGKSFEIHNGRNFVGSSMSMDIVLTSDISIASENHFSIIFDNKTNRFYVMSGVSSVFINGKRVTEPCEIFENDLISIGESNYIFVPYCKEGRNWNDK